MIDRDEVIHLTRGQLADYVYKAMCFGMVVGAFIGGVSLLCAVLVSR